MSRSDSDPGSAGSEEAQPIASDDSYAAERAPRTGTVQHVTIQ